MGRYGEIYDRINNLAFGIYKDITVSVIIRMIVQDELLIYIYIYIRLIRSYCI